MQRPDGTEGDPRPVVFDLTQKGKVLTGTAGPTAQWKVEKGAVNAGKPRSRSSSPTARSSSSRWRSSRDACEGDMAGERDGVVRGHAKVEAKKAK